MSMITQFIYVGDIQEQEEKKEAGYKVTAEDSMKNLARLNIECLKTNSDDVLNSQGVYLTASECRAVANMLNTCAIVLEDRKKSII